MLIHLIKKRKNHDSMIQLMALYHDSMIMVEDMYLQKVARA